MKKFIAAAVVFFGITALTAAETVTADLVKFAKVELNHDGIPDEPFWSKAGVIDQFRRFRKFAQPAAAKTTVKLCMDKRNLYIAFICDDPEGVTVGDPNGSPWSGDNVELFLACTTGHDWYRQLVFGLNGKKYIEFCNGDKLIWKSFAGKNYWSAELIIPLEELGAFSGNDLRFNVLRSRKSFRELQTWSNIYWGHEPLSYGRLTVVQHPDDITYGPWTHNVTASAAQVGWYTKEKCDMMFFYRKKGDTAFNMLPVPQLAGVPENAHHIQLKGLQPDTVYEYHFSGDQKLYSFRTLTDKKADFSFALTADTHCRGAKIRNILTNKEVKKADMIFHMGDMITGMVGIGSFYDAFLEPLVKNWDKNFYAIRGNHETRGEWKIYYDILHPFTRKGYSAFTHKGVFFIILETDADIPDYPNCFDEQQKFLREVTASAEFKNAQYRVLLAHMPLMTPQIGAGHELVKLFNTLPESVQKSFDLAVSGHVHSYEKVMPGAEALFSERASRNGRKPMLKLNFPVFVCPADGFFTVDKTDESMTVKAYHNDSTLIDTVVINAR